MEGRKNYFNTFNRSTKWKRNFYNAEQQQQQEQKKAFRNNFDSFILQIGLCRYPK